jgi:hypothetical protein
MRRTSKFLLLSFAVWIFTASMSKGQECPFLNKAQEGVKRDLSQWQTVQRVKWTKLLNRSDTIIEYRYQDEGGTPRSTLKNGIGVVVLPRLYFLGIVAWADALTMCELESANCIGLSDYADAFQTARTKNSIPFRNMLSGESEDACKLRGTKNYSELFKSYFESSMLAVQAHESAHIFLGHHDEGNSVPDSKQEIHADAFAHYVISTSPPLTPKRAAPAFLPLIMKSNYSSTHPDVFCRASQFGLPDALAESNLTEKCGEYVQEFIEGMELSRQSIKSDYEILSVP